MEKIREVARPMRNQEVVGLWKFSKRPKVVGVGLGRAEKREQQQGRRGMAKKTI